MQCQRSSDFTQDPWQIITELLTRNNDHHTVTVDYWSRHFQQINSYNIHISIHKLSAMFFQLVPLNNTSTDISKSSSKLCSRFTLTAASKNRDGRIQQEELNQWALGDLAVCTTNRIRILFTLHLIRARKHDTVWQHDTGQNTVWNSSPLPYLWQRQCSRRVKLSLIPSIAPDQGMQLNPEPSLNCEFDRAVGGSLPLWDRKTKENELVMVFIFRENSWANCSIFRLKQKSCVFTLGKANLNKPYTAIMKMICLFLLADFLKILLDTHNAFRQSRWGSCSSSWVNDLPHMPPRSLVCIYPVYRENV